MSEVVEFSGLDEAQEILNLMMRHWNKIAAMLRKGETMFRSSLRTRKASFMATTGHADSCGGCRCATMLGLSLSTTRNMAAP